MFVHLWDNWTYGAVRPSLVQLGQNWYLYCTICIYWLNWHRSYVKKVIAENYIHPAFSYTFEGHGKVFKGNLGECMYSHCTDGICWVFGSLMCLERQTEMYHSVWCSSKIAFVFYQGEIVSYKHVVICLNQLSQLV